MIKPTGAFAIFVVAASLAGNAAAAPSKCVADGSPATAVGVIRLRHNRDRATGKPYTYVVLETNSTYCISDDDADDRSKTPTATIGIANPDAKKPETLESEARRYLDKSVLVRGRLVGTNGGGPYLWYDHIEPK